MALNLNQWLLTASHPRDLRGTHMGMPRFLCPAAAVQRWTVARLKVKNEFWNLTLRIRRPSCSHVVRACLLQPILVY